MKRTAKTGVAILSFAIRLIGPRGVCVLAAFLASIAGTQFSQRAFAMGTEEKGNKPLSEFNYTRWKGIVPIVNSHVRVYQVWINGNESLYYKGTTEQFNEALAAFAKVEVKNHVVVLRPGPVATQSFDKKPIPYNWELHVLSGIALSRATDDIEDLVWQKDPVLTVHIDDGIELKKIEIPEGVTLRSAPGQNEVANRNDEINRRIEEFVKQRSTQKK